MKALSEEISAFTGALAAGEMEAVEAKLQRAAAARTQLPAKNKGFLTLLHELVVVIQDRPGAIAEVVEIIKGINLKDIEILRVREGEGGALRLAFEDKDDLQLADRLLRAEGFVTQVRGGNSR